MEFDFNKANKSDQEDVLKEIDECLKIAFKHNGYVRGPHVRNVIVPRHFNPICDVKLGKIDIVFDNNVDSDAFYDEMNRNNRLICECAPGNKYYLTKFGTKLVKINLWNSEFYPNNHNIDELIAYGYVDGYQFRTLNGLFRVQYFLEVIKDKKLIVGSGKWHKWIHNEALLIDELAYLNKHF